MPPKRAKKKPSLPRKRWVINPVTRVKESSKKYSRPAAKERARQARDDEAS